jgi:hypothetical protein
VPRLVPSKVRIDFGGGGGAAAALGGGGGQVRLRGRAGKGSSFGTVFVIINATMGEPEPEV